MLFREDFESGLANWTAEGLWHVEDASQECAAALVPFPSGVKAAWYGSAATCRYASGHEPQWLKLVTPIPLPPAGTHPVLRFRRFQETVSCTGGFEITSFAFSTDGGANWDQQVHLDCRPSHFLPWQTSRVPIDGLAGMSVLVGFQITVDPLFNTGLGWWIDDVEIAVEPGTTSCTATTLSCPCQNAWSTLDPYGTENYGGCLNSRHAEAVLYGDGIASVANDTVVLRVADMPPNASALLVQGNSAASTAFGDGLLCLAGPLTRLRIHTGTQPVEPFPGPGESGLAMRGGIPPAGGVRSYQVVYRDAGAWCTSATWNTSNAYRIEWAP